MNRRCTGRNYYAAKKRWHHRAFVVVVIPRPSPTRGVDSCVNIVDDHDERKLEQPHARGPKDVAVVTRVFAPLPRPRKLKHSLELATRVLGSCWHGQQPFC